MIRSEVAANRDGSGLSVGVVVSRFAKFDTQPLLDGALRLLEEAGVEKVVVVEVAGALEAPVVAAVLAKTMDAVVALGAVIKGETDHYHHVATQSAAGLARVSLDTGTPVANGVLTVRNALAAAARSRPNLDNRGREAAAAALVAANALRSLQNEPQPNAQPLGEDDGVAESAAI